MVHQSVARFMVNLSNHPYSKEIRSQKMLKLSYYKSYQQYKQTSTDNYIEQIIPQAEDILAEEQAGFRKNRSTTEQILNCRLIIEKHIDHKRQVYHNIIDNKKAFDRVCHEGLWHMMSSFGIGNDIIQCINSLYNSSKSSILLNNNIGTNVNTTVGVRQG